MDLFIIQVKKHSFENIKPIATIGDDYLVTPCFLISKRDAAKLKSCTSIVVNTVDEFSDIIYKKIKESDVAFRRHEYGKLLMELYDTVANVNNDALFTDVN